MTHPHDDQPRPARAAMHWAWLLIAPVLLVGLVAVIAGMIAGASDAGGEHSVRFYIALALAASLLMATLWLTLRLLPQYRLPRSPKMRQGQLLLYASGLLGAIIGGTTVFLQWDDPQGPLEMLMGRAPLPPAMAAILVAGAIVGLILSVRWHLLLDEHERAAYDFGAVAAIYVYFTLSVVWWLLWRAALVPAPHGVGIFVAVMVTWMLGWLLRRYR